MATYIMSWVVKASSDQDAASVQGEADNLIGSFNQGDPNGITGFLSFAGGVVKILDSNLGHI